MNSLWTHVVGLAPILTTYSFMFLLAGGTLAFAYFSPIFKKTALWVALGLVTHTVAYGIGVNHGADRVRAQWQNEKASINETVDNAIRDAHSPQPDGVRDPFQLD